MKVKVGAAFVVAAAVVVSGSIGVGEAMATAKAHQPKHPSATYTMYANVDAEGDLGSHYDATKVTFDSVQNVYHVTFSKRIGSCAAVAQPGKAGGPDGVNPDMSSVTNDGNYKTTKSLKVIFTNVHDGYAQEPEPFMLTVVCRYTK
jgi:hypothetical protein